MDKPVVLITGASSGIGEMTAKTLGASGFRVILAARRVARLEQIADQIRGAGGQAVPLQLDLSRLEEIEKAVAGIKQEFGPIQILVNNAGSARHLWLDELAPGPDIQLQLQVNLIGMIQLTRAVLPDMLKPEAVRSFMSHRLLPGSVFPPIHLQASKFGSRGFFEGLRRELRGTGVFCFRIFPGAVDTEFEQDPQVCLENYHNYSGLAVVTPQDVADKIHDLIRTRTSQVRFCRDHVGPAIWANTLFPGLVSWVLSQFFYGGREKQYSWEKVRRIKKQPDWAVFLFR